MCRQNANDNPKDHAKDKWYNIKPTARGKAVSYIVLYLLFIVVDAHDIFPWRHDVAIFAGAAATIALLYAEAFAIGAITSIAWVALSATVAVTAFGLNLYVGPNLPAETETHGWLIPANDPAPPSSCSDTNIAGHDAIIVFLGGSVGSSRARTLVGLEIGDCNVISMTRHDSFVSVDANIFEPHGTLVARISSGEFRLMPYMYSYADRPDRSTIIVYDRRGNELFYIRYLNPQMIKIRGTFACEHEYPVVVTDSEILLHSGSRISHSCTIDKSGPGPVFVIQ
jgi:hypothetical protein